ncbi:hypothetical protein T459_19558 [Capsicum annuum]|uniref:Uncharacterized protein n=1 Tax=Capsicum annuum TaxID=4072 RepID=A0A2G2Z218_CAPAN|nr:putative domain-containing protein-like [Capsicum annuum]PHT76036.1 hypothetical protein T459_19558 [Capsicum annuum]
MLVRITKRAGERVGSGLMKANVEKANRAVEVNEMWKLRQKELELENRLNRKSADKKSDTCHSFSVLERRSRERCDTDSGTSRSKKREVEDSHSCEEEGLGDAEIEEFLHLRIKRARGTVGSRMDEAGPYLPSSPDPREKESASPNMKLSKVHRYHAVIGPEKPDWLNSTVSSENESLSDDKIKIPKKAKSSPAGSTTVKAVGSDGLADGNSPGLSSITVDNSVEFTYEELAPTTNDQCSLNEWDSSKDLGSRIKPSRHLY